MGVACAEGKVVSLGSQSGSIMKLSYIGFSRGWCSRDDGVKSSNEEVSDQLTRLESGKSLKDRIIRSYDSLRLAVGMPPEWVDGVQEEHHRRQLLRAVCIHVGKLFDGVGELPCARITSEKEGENSESFTGLGSGKFVKSGIRSLWSDDVCLMRFDVPATCVAGFVRRWCFSEAWVEGEEVEDCEDVRLMEMPSATITSGNHCCCGFDVLDSIVFPELLVLSICSIDAHVKHGASDMLEYVLSGKMFYGKSAQLEFKRDLVRRDISVAVSVITDGRFESGSRVDDTGSERRSHRALHGCCCCGLWSNRVFIENRSS